MSFSSRRIETVNSVSCPTCGAAPGKRCQSKLSPPYHSARASLAPLKNINFRNYPLWNHGENPSGLCEKNSHSRCLGRHKGTYGVRGPLCTCECHISQRKHGFGKGNPLKEPKPKAEVNLRVSSKCQKEKHDQCTKIRREWPSNLSVPCECSCHRPDSA